MKTLSLLFTILFALSAKAAVFVLPISGFPNTTNLQSVDLFVVAVTNAPGGATNKNIKYQDLFHQITSSIPVVVNSFTNGSNFFTVGGYWTNMTGFIQPLGGSTNTAKFSTNNNRGILIGDTNIATTWFGWPSDGQSYLSVYDGSTGHLLNRWTHGVLQPSTTNGSYAVVTSQSGVNPTLTEAFVVLTNGVIASEFDINMQRTGSYLLLGGNVNDGFVGIQHGAQVSTPIGPNLIRAKWGGADRFFLSTNGGVSFFGSATNYGILYAKSNFTVSGATLLNGTFIAGDTALFLKGLASLGITNTIGFQTLGRISLGDDPSELTTSSNTFRQYGPMHIHDGNLFLQDIGISANRMMYLNAARQVTTVATIDPTEVGFLDGVTSPISSLVNNPGVVTNIIGVGIGVSSNGGNWTITGTGAGNPNTATNISGGGGTTVTSNNLGGWTITSTVGGGGSSMWTNEAEHAILRPIAGSTNFIGGGTLSAIATNTVFATIAGGSGNLVGSNISWATIGGGLQNQVGAGSLAGTVSGGRQNVVLTNYATVGGGFSNDAEDRYVTVGGGFQNTARDENATISGGADNLSDGKNTTIGGGINNKIDFNTDGGGTIGGGYHNTVSQDYGVIAGGASNLNNSAFSAIVGGYHNIIFGNAASGSEGKSFIGGGASNKVGFAAASPAHWGVIGGGTENQIRERGEWSVIGGGRLNQIEGGLGVGATIAGGMSNLTLAGSSHVTISGGASNLIAGSSPAATVGGGALNAIKANAGYSVIGGGEGNSIDGNLGGYVVSGGHAVVSGGFRNTNSALMAVISGGYLNTIQSNAYLSVIGGGSFSIIQTNSANSVIAGGSLNSIGSFAQDSVISGGGTNRIGIGSSNSVIVGGFDNAISNNTPNAVAIGSYLSVTNAYAIELGTDVFRTNKVRIDGTNLHLVGEMKIKMTTGAVNGAVLTSDANGVLTLQSFGGGGGGGSSGSGTFINSSNGFGTNASLYGTSAFTGTVTSVVTNIPSATEITVNGQWQNHWLSLAHNTTIVVSNILTGQWPIVLAITNTGSFSATFPQFPAGLWENGIILDLPPGASTIIFTSPTSGLTNIAMRGGALSLAAGTGVTFTTNAQALTISASGGGGIHLVGHEYFEDFLGAQLSTAVPGFAGLGLYKAVAGTGASGANGVPQTNAPGTQVLSTGTQSGGTAFMYNFGAGADNAIYNLRGIWTNEWRLRFTGTNDVSGTNNNFQLCAGFSDNAGVAVPNDGVQFFYSSNSPFLGFLSASNSVRTTNYTALRPVPDTWYKVRMVVTANASAINAVCTVDDANTVNLTTTIPTGGTRNVALQAGLSKVDGITSRSVEVDYVYLGFTLETTR